MIFINTAEFLIFSRAQSPLSRTARMKQKIRPENTSRILSPAFGIMKQGIGILGKKNFFQSGRGIWIGRILKLIQRFLINSNIMSCIYNWTCLFFSQVENVMNAAVLYYDTITKYRDFKCKAGRGAIGACLQGTFDGEEYFNEFILKHDGQPLFGDKLRRVKLDSCGDSTPRYAIYQLQNTRLTYRVRPSFLFSLPQLFINDPFVENRNMVKC